MEVTGDSRPPNGLVLAFKRSLLGGTLPVVIVNPDELSRSLLAMLQTIYKGRTRPVYYAATLDEARRLLGEQHTLEPPPLPGD